MLARGRPALAAYRGLLTNRNYRLWFFSSLGSSVGDWAGLFALQVLVLRFAERGSQLALFGLGGIMMARLLPSVLFGPVAGVLADRYDRKRLMVATDLLRGALFVAIAFSGDLVALFTLTFLVECLSLLYISAKDASLPTIVRRDHLAEANQLNLLVTYGPLPFGALLTAAMAGLASWLASADVIVIDAAVLALLVNAATFLLAGCLLFGLRLPPHGRRARPAGSGEEKGVVEEVREGLAFIANLPLIRSLIFGVVGAFFGAGVVVTLGPEFVRSSLGRSETDWFTLMTVVGVGLLIGIVAAPVLSSRFSKARLFPIFLIATGAVATVTSLLQTFTQTLVAGPVLGAAAGVSFVMGYTLLHELTEDAVRARTFAAFYTSTRISMFAALGLAPFVAGTVGLVTIGLAGEFLTISGVRVTIMAGGIVALASAVRAARGMYRSLRDEEDGARATMRLPATKTTVPLDASEDRQGVFVAFEGVEGAGKSLQVQRLAETLEAEGRDVLVTREPGGPPVAERVRELLLDPEIEGMDPRTEALLYAAARAEHVHRVIRPALEDGTVVLCDRFVDSSRAYQGHARDLGDEAIAELNRWGIGGLLPDAVVLLHLDPSAGLARAAERSSGQDTRRLRPAAAEIEGPAEHDTEADDRRGRDAGGPDRMEREDLEFHQRVGDAYLRIAKADRDRFVVVDATGEPDAVARQVRSGLHSWLPLPKSDERRAEARDAQVEGDAGA